MPKTEFARFDVTTTDNEMSFIIDIRQGEFVLAAAQSAVERYNRQTDSKLEVVDIQLMCVVEY